MNKETVLQIDLDKLDPNQFAKRISYELGDLTESMRNSGQLSPIGVRESKIAGRYEIVFGHRRVAAARQLGWKSISAQVINATNDQMVAFALTENLDRANYSDYEIGINLRNLVDNFGKSIADAASMIGRSKAYVSDHIAMTHLFDSPSIDQNEAVKVYQRITERQARALARVSDPQTRLTIAKFALSENLGIKELEKLIGHPRESKKIEGGDEKNSQDISIIKSQPRDDESITQIIEEVLEGISNKDLRPVRGYRSPKLFSLFDDFPPLTDALGYEKATEHIVRHLKKIEDLKLNHEKLQIHIFGKFAYATFIATYRMRYLGKWATGRSRVTFIFLLVEDKWLIIHEHWSALDLEFLEELQRLTT